MSKTLFNGNEDTVQASKTLPLQNFVMEDFHVRRIEDAVHGRRGGRHNSTSQGLEVLSWLGNTSSASTRCKDRSKKILEL